MGLVERWKTDKILYRTNSGQGRHFVIFSGVYDGSFAIGGYWTGGYKPDGRKETDFPNTFTHLSPIVIPEEFLTPILTNIINKVGNEEKIIIEEILKKIN